MSLRRYEQSCRGNSGKIQCFAGLIAVLGLAGTCSALEVQLTSLTGERRLVDLRTIDEQGEVTLNNGRVRVDQLREIRRNDPTVSGSNAVGGNHAVVNNLIGQGELLADAVTVADEHCLVSGHALGDEPLRLPLDMVTAIQLQPKQVSDALRDTLCEQQRDDDQLHLRVDGSAETITGLIEALDDAEVSFLWDDEVRKLPRDKLVAIAVASTTDATDGKRNCLVRFVGGSAVGARILGLEDDELRLEVAEGLSVTVSSTDVESISIRSARLQFLSDLQPVSAEHRPIVTSTRTWKKDRNVAGDTLKIGDESYSKGIGVASHSRLAYQLQGEFHTLCATIGIDSGTEGRGDCVFVVRGDGNELTRASMKGSDPPQRLQIDIRGVKELELVVEAGGDLDLADHANWCDACLLR